LPLTPSTLHSAKQLRYLAGSPMMLRLMRFARGLRMLE
jgi:hypothetical protein